MKYLLEVFLIYFFIGNKLFGSTSSVSPVCMKAFSVLSKHSSASSPRHLLKPEDPETIKSYIFQGPILNFYLRNQNDRSMDVILDSMLANNKLNKDEVEKIVRNLDALIAQHSHNQTEKIYFRGGSRPNDGSLQVGKELKYENYISTTRDKNLAWGYAQGHNDASGLKIMYEITVKPGQNGLQINELAPEGMRNQDEFLLPRNSTLVIDDIKSENGFTYIKAHLK